MGRSKAKCAEDRERLYDGEIRGFLAAGDDWKALKRAIDYLLSEAWKRREEKPADGALINADLAGLLRDFAATLPSLKPTRPRGFSGTPRPGDLLAVYEEAMLRSAGEGA
jgi:hypothetical protein